MEKVLKQAGYEVDVAASSMEGIEKFTMNRDYDLIISDLVMDEIDGIKFLSYIKKVSPGVKTMILTAEPSAQTEMASLDIAVDKYLVKESKIEVILRYIEVLLAQPAILSKPEKMILKSDAENVIMDVTGLSIMKNGAPLDPPLTFKEFQILKFLLEHKGVALSREEILDEVWDTSHEVVETRVVDVHIKAIRRKLGAQSILAIRGYGYKWDE